MIDFGLSFCYLLAQLLSFVIVFGWITLGVISLIKLRRLPLPPTVKAI
ncbi:MAG: hypothetical protein FD147_1933 [Chloroflexi bacterium]|nr:MAG: hypothetical protein FD147_1933 [Chloroflexota bacterium]